MRQGGRLRLWILVMALLPLLTAVGLAAAAAGPSAKGNYLMGCVGCHGETGVTIAQKVPDLKDQVGFFLNTKDGREYLARLPNVAFAPLPNRELADMLNYIVFTLGAESAPKGAKPYSAAEVGRLRKQPLTEVPLFKYRADIVDRLIDQYQAPDAMRFYGVGLYDH